MENNKQQIIADYLSAKTKEVDSFLEKWGNDNKANYLPGEVSELISTVGDVIKIAARELGVKLLAPECSLETGNSLKSDFERKIKETKERLS